MVQPEYGPRSSIDDQALVKAGDQLVEAKRAWAEAFLRFKIGARSSVKITDNVAKAQADIEVGVTQAEVDWELAKRGI